MTVDIASPGAMATPLVTVGVRLRRSPHFLVGPVR
jgi:hypothetical protein